MALVPTSNGNQMIALPIKALSTANLVNAKQIQITTISQLNASSSSNHTIGNNITLNTQASSSSGSASNAVPIAIAPAVTLEQSGTSTNIRIPNKLTANIVSIPKDSLDENKIKLVSASPANSLYTKSKITLIKKDGSEIVAQVLSTDKPIVTTANCLPVATLSAQKISANSSSLVRPLSESIRVEKPLESQSFHVKPPEKLIEMRLNPTAKGVSLISATVTNKSSISHKMGNERQASLSNTTAITVPSASAGSPPPPPSLILCTDRSGQPLVANNNSSSNNNHNHCDNSNNNNNNGNEEAVVPESDFDPYTFLKWKNGIGYLPGTEISFKCNEFGYLEIVGQSEINEFLQLLNAKLNEEQAKNDNGLSPKELRVCSHCGFQGLLSTFVRKGRFCSQNCAIQSSSRLLVNNKLTQNQQSQTTGKRKLPEPSKQGRKGKQLCAAKSENLVEDIQSVLQAENVKDVKSLVTEHPSINKSFAWHKYLLDTKSYPASVKFFRPNQSNADRNNHFKVNMKLEGIDPQHPSLFCVLTVAEVSGMRLRLRFDGYESAYDFWTYADSPFIFPAGFCLKTNRKLQPPKHIENFNWSDYLIHCQSRAAPESIFYWNNKSVVSQTGIKVGMKLEAVDRANTSLVCVATVADIIGNWLLIHFDGWDDSYDYWTETSSPYIHPINWCRSRGKPLTPPKDYPKSSDKFNWDKYLIETGSTLVPPRLLTPRLANRFKSGMKLEVVDKRNPRCVRVATIVNRQSHAIKIHFDNWDSKYDYWIDDDSPDLHPINWCYKTGHNLEEPPTAEFETNSFYNRCSTFGCKGIGNRLDASLLDHSSLDACPYTDEHLDYEAGDRLGEEESDGEMPVPSPDSQAKVTPENTQNESSFQSYESDNECRSITPDSDVEMCPIQQSIREVRESLHVIEEAPIGWEQHSRSLLESAKAITPLEMVSWSHQDVFDFVSSLPGCKESARIFDLQGVDGPAFLLMNQTDMVKVMGIKLGPAIKIYNAVLLLRNLMGKKPKPNRS